MQIKYQIKRKRILTIPIEDTLPIFEKAEESFLIIIEIKWNIV